MNVKKLLFILPEIIFVIIIFPLVHYPVFAAVDHLVINEVMYNPASTDTGLEWIKLFNPTDRELNLEGYQLNAYSGDYYTFPNVTVFPDSFITVHWAKDGENTSTDLYTGKSDYTNMSNTSGWVALFQNSNHDDSSIVDYLEYGAGGKTWESLASGVAIWEKGSFIPTVSEGHTLKLKTDGEDNNSINDWFESTLLLPTSTPTDTPVPTPTKIPTPTKAPTPTKTPTPTKIPTPTKTPAPTKSPIPAKTITLSETNNNDNSEIATTDTENPKPTAALPETILGESTESAEVSPTKKPENKKTGDVKVSGVKEFNIFSIFIPLGGIFLLVCGILLYRKYRPGGSSDKFED